MSIFEYMKKEWLAFLCVAIGVCGMTVGVLANLYHSAFNVSPLEVRNKIALCEAKLPRNVDCEAVVSVMPAPLAKYFREEVARLNAKTGGDDASL